MNGVVGKIGRNAPTTPSATKNNPAEANKMRNG